MPREEAGEIADFVKSESVKLFGDAIQVTACGSYRRGKKTCGDVDCLITRTDSGPIDGLLEKLLNRLEALGFLRERLSFSGRSYMGVCQAEGRDKARRIDIKVYPKEEYGFALLYFTGSDYFNRSMRLYAEKKGYTLSDHGLAPVQRVKGEKVSKGMVVPCQTEEAVFKALGLPYKTPAERDL